MQRNLLTCEASEHYNAKHAAACHESVDRQCTAKAFRVYTRARLHSYQNGVTTRRRNSLVRITHFSTQKLARSDSEQSPSSVSFATRGGNSHGRERLSYLPRSSAKISASASHFSSPELTQSEPGTLHLAVSSLWRGI